MRAGLRETDKGASEQSERLLVGGAGPPGSGARPVSPRGFSVRGHGDRTLTIGWGVPRADVILTSLINDPSMNIMRYVPIFFPRHFEMYYNSFHDADITLHNMMFFKVLVLSL